MRSGLFTVGWILFAISVGAQAPFLTFEPPSEWIKRETTSQEQLARYYLPRMNSDREDADLVVLYFGNEGVSSESHLEQWTNEMLQSDERPSADVATTTSFQVSDMPVTLLDVPGIYAATVHPGSKMRYYKPGYRLHAAVVESEDGPVFFKLIGPDHTVTHWEPWFTELLESTRFP